MNFRKNQTKEDSMKIILCMVAHKCHQTVCDDFDFDIVNFLFWMVTFLVVLLMVYTFRNLLGLLESAIMLQTSTLEINV